MQLAFSRDHTYGEEGITLPILLWTGATPVELNAIVDTGSDFCLFETGYAEMLGLHLEGGIRKRFRTVAGSFEAYGHEVEIEALGHRTAAIVYFFADPLIRKNVLGRQGWLDRVRLGVVHYDRQLYLAGHNEA